MLEQNETGVSGVREDDVTSTVGSLNSSMDTWLTSARTLNHNTTTENPSNNTGMYKMNPCTKMLFILLDKHEKRFFWLA